MRSRRRNQSGFTIVEMIIVTCIIAVLASVAINSVREYTRRAKMSEVVLASSTCRTLLSESFPVLDSAPPAGRWGCEQAGSSNFAGAVQTSSKGVVRISIRNLDPLVNGHHVFLVPARNNGARMAAPADLGNGVRSWICGSDWLPARNALPANCREDTTTFASEEFGPE